MDPNDQTTPGADAAADPANAAASVDGAAAIDAALSAKPENEEDVIAGMDAAIAAADAGEPIKPGDVSAKPDKPAKADKPADGADPTKDGKDPAAAKDPKAEAEAAAALLAKDPEAAKKLEKEKADKADDDEAKALNLKGPANKRFREMANEIRELKPLKAMKDELEKAGIKDLAELPKMVERSKAADDMISMVMDTGATAEQYGMTLDYLGVVNKALQGDAAAGEKAWEMWLSEGKELAKGLGKEFPGVYDPLAEHKDLTDAIAAGDMDRKFALELAGKRRGEALQAQLREQGVQTTAQTRAIETGTTTLATWDQTMLANDKGYMAKREALSTMVTFIKQTLPPAKWLEATQRAYATIPEPVAAAAAVPAKVPVGPVRAGGGAQRPLVQSVFEDPMDAIDAGIEAAKAA